MNIESVKISDIKLDSNNINVHDEKSVAALAASLSEFGQQKVVVIDSQNIVRAGNGIVLAAMRLNWQEVMAHRTDLSGPKLDAYAIADNKTAMFSGFDQDKLAQAMVKIEEQNGMLLAKIKAEDGSLDSLRDSVDIDTKKLLDATGFSDDDRQRMQASMNVLPPRNPKDDDADDDDDGLPDGERFGVVVPCGSEESQQECYNAMVALGYKARKLRT